MLLSTVHSSLPGELNEQSTDDQVILELDI